MGRRQREPPRLDLRPDREERRRLLERGAAEAPEVVRLEREGAQDVAEWDFSDFPPSAQLAVVVADSQDFGNLGSQEAHRRLWAERSREWLHLSVDARLTVAEGSGHMVHRDRPDTVASHVLALIAASR